MNKIIIALGILFFFISFILFMSNETFINKETIKEETHNDDVFYKISNPELCELLNMKEHNSTHCLITSFPKNET